MHKCNAYAVDTKKPSREILKYTMRLLKRGLGIVLFPEGTRSKKGHFLDFNPGVGWLALKCQVPVVPTLIRGVNTPLVSQLIRRNRTCVKFGIPVVPSELEMDRRQGGFRSVQEKSKIVAQEVENRVKELHENS
jgi:1-acyl-sn-glycerol-3-phosphate acyltransferase